MKMKILGLLMLALFFGCGGALAPTGTPLPPQLPQDFQWVGRYIVKDMDIEVPFTWHGNDGKVQMIAGGEEDEIFFTNIIFDGHLYTLTNKWPGVEPNPNDPSKLPDCICLGEFTLGELNACLVKSHYVGPETIQDPDFRSVHHFRISVVLELAPDPNPSRLPLMLGDFYVDQNDSSKFWRVLHFGIHNALDPALDEWIVIDNFEQIAGEVTLPDRCDPDTCPPIPLTADSCK